METWTIFLLLIGGLLIFLAMGLPIAFSFFLINSNSYIKNNQKIEILF